MISWSHVGETAALMAAAYALGCAIGFFAYRLAQQAGGKAIPASAEAIDLAAQIAARLPPAPMPEVEAPPAEPVPVPPEPVPAPAVELNRLPPAAAEPEPAPAAAPQPRPGKPRTLAKPRGGLKDDLKAIKGIGPRLEPRLNDLGIFHIGQIAGWSRANADWVSRELGFPGRVEREAWVAQAKAMTPRPKTGKGRAAP
jgi:NADH-quinone oxidoreductase subunit E